MGGTALVLLACVMCPGLFPGEPAETIAVIGGRGPLPSLTHPLWESVVRIAQRLPFPLFIRTLNGFNVVVGAAAAALLFHLAAMFRTSTAACPPPQTAPDDSSDKESPAPPLDTPQLAHVPAILAVLLGAGSFPFLFIATRCHPAALTTVLWLGGVGLAAAYGRSGKRRRLYAAAALLGLASAESPGTWFLWPVLLPWLTLLLLAHRDLVLPFMPDASRGHLAIRVPLIAGAILLGALLAPWVVRAAIFQREAAAAWADAESFGPALREVLRAQLRAVRTAIPPVGWLLPALCVGLPGALVVAAFAGERPERRGPAAASLLLVSAVAVSVAFDAPFAPWPIFQASPLLVVPYGVMALWTAAAAAGLIRLFLHDLDRRDLPGPLARLDLTPARRRKAAVAYTAAMVLSFGAAAGRHLRQVALCDSTPFDQFASNVLEELEGSERVVLASPLEPLLTVRARSERPDLRFLNVQLGRHPVYLRYVADIFADDPRARGLAPAGLDALLADWFVRDPSVTGRVVTLDLPELWRLGGWTALPARLSYRGVAALDASTLAARWAGFPAWTSQLAAAFARLDRLPRAFEPYAVWLRRHSSRLLNDFGFMLEEIGRSAEALTAFDAAAALDAEQFSARHNRARLARDLGHPSAERAQQDLERWLAQRPAFDRVAAARWNGLIRDPNLQYRRSALAARSGLLDFALSDLIDLRHESDAPAVQLAMAAVLEGRGNVAQSRALFQQLAEQHPDRIELQLAAGLAALNAGDVTSAVAVAHSLRNRQPPTLPVYEALLAAMTGDVATARGILTRRLADSPDDRAAHIANGFVAAKAGDIAALRRTVDSLRSRNLRIPWLETVLADALAGEGRTAEAREIIEQVVARHPAFGPAWDVLLALDVAERRSDRAREHAARLLRLRPGHPRANHIWASLLIAEGRWEDAAAALEVARRSAPDDAAILNDLAWCRLHLGDTGRALDLATRAVALEPNSAVHLDTLARALLAAGQTNRAAEVVHRALRIAPDDAELRALATQLRTVESPR
ncbi:MAG: tetratricopeptide repeat protein [Kiritimatiellae bacterium]|nr:tetratricopeptide repeat protein [Kiritimatiellia bacterium]